MGNSYGIAYCGNDRVSDDIDVLDCCLPRIGEEYAAVKEEGGGVSAGEITRADYD
jgi:hypothetical protein